MKRYAIVRALRVFQRNRCTICGGTLAPEGVDHRRGTAASIEHVYPLSRYRAWNGTKPRKGNVMLTHRRCNGDKGDRDPTGCEIVWLHAVNAHMGWDKRRLRRKQA